MLCVQVYFLSSTLPRFNFAACWNGSYSQEDYIRIKELRGKGYRFPSITFVETESGWHLMLDAFRNNWQLSETRLCVDEAAVESDPDKGGTYERTCISCGALYATNYRKEYDAYGGDHRGLCEPRCGMEGEEEKEEEEVEELDHSGEDDDW